jgi:tetratricopeptide (TPR) repeat protein
MIAGLGAVAMAAGLATHAAAVEDYDACVSLVEADPARAEREAGDWARFGGGAPARHCYALALIAIGAPISAADEMVAAASEEPGLSDLARSDLLAQAGELLVEADDDLIAALVAEQAVRLAPTNGRALGLRAAVRLRAGEVRAALRDLDEAIRAGPPTGRLLTLRAACHRRLGSATAARADALYATELSPDHAPAWVERGRAEAKLGDRHAARQSFLRAIDLDRDGRLGQAARRALQRMEAGYED